MFSAKNLCVCCKCESQDYKNINEIELTYAPLRLYEILYKTVPAMGQMNKQNPNKFPLSEIICLTCYGNLLRVYEFQEQCLASLERAKLQLETQTASVDTLQTNEEIKVEIENVFVEEKFTFYNEDIENEPQEELPSENEETKDLSVEDVDFSNPLDFCGNDEDVFPVKTENPEINKSRSKSRIRRNGYNPCQDCGRVFGRAHDLQRHRSVHSPEKPLKCNFCNYRYSTQTFLKTHISKHHYMESNKIKQQEQAKRKKNEDGQKCIVRRRRKRKEVLPEGQKKMVSCDVCGKKFNLQHQLKRHSRVHSLERPFECNICSYRFSTPRILQRHTSRHENEAKGIKRSGPKHMEVDSDGYYKCPDCPKRFKTKNQLWGHRKLHTGSKPGGPCSCSICGTVFTSKSSLKEHTIIEHPEVELHKCDQCDKTYVLHAHLLEHINRHNNNLICLTCKKEFARPSGMNAHNCTLSSSQTPYLCTECGKSFKVFGTLQQHIEIHTNLRKYQCPECPSRFNTKSCLIKHASTHAKVKPHVCDICSSTFTRLSSLRQHKILHTGERPYKCDQCNMTFAMKYTLHRHTRTHTGDKPLKCKFCDRAYAEYGDLTKHLRTHLGENTYMCDECPKAFKYQTELRQHKSEHFKAAQKRLEQAQNQSHETEDQINNEFKQLPCTVKAVHHDIWPISE